MSGETKSHGTLVAVELTPGGAFTDVARLNGDISPPGIMVGETEVTPHNDLKFDSWVPGSVRRDPLTFACSAINGNNTQDELTGIQALLIARTTTGMRFTKTDSGVLIMSGFFTQWKERAPVRDGAIVSDVIFRPSGPYKINSTLFNS